jgi:hypothetical protein
MGAYADAVHADSPAFYYRCNEPGGMLANTSFGHSYPALAPGMPTVNLPNPALQLGYTGIARDGGGVFVGQASGFWATHIFGSVAPLVPPYAVEAWVAQIQWAGNGYAQGTMALLAWGGIPGQNRIQAVYNVSTQQMQAAFRNNTGADITTVISTSTISDGNYHHLVGAVDTAGASYFVDGVLVGTASLTPVQYSVGPFTMGFGDQNANSTGFAGARIGTELAVYVGGLTSTRIAAHYAAREILDKPRYRNGLQTGC